MFSGNVHQLYSRVMEEAVGNGTIVDSVIDSMQDVVVEDEVDVQIHKSQPMPLSYR